MKHEELINKIRRKEIDINNQSLFFSILIKGLMRKLYDDLAIRDTHIPHIILNTGDDTMYLNVKGYDHSKEPLSITNENFVYNEIPRCMVSPKGINLVSDQLTSPYSNGVFQYEDNEEIVSFTSEFRRMPLTMSFEMTYYLDSYTDMLDLIQQVVTKLNFIQTYKITYLGQTITCSYKMPDSFDGEYTMDISGDTSDEKYRKVSISIEVESNLPIFNERSVVCMDNMIRHIDWDVTTPSQNNEVKPVV